MSHGATGWQQGLDNYHRALARLEEIADLAAARELTRIERQALIKGFEYTHELAWNVMKDYFAY